MNKNGKGAINKNIIKDLDFLNRHLNIKEYDAIIINNIVIIINPMKL